MNENKHKVVGVFSQLRILLWKNRILFQRNTSGTLAEILVAFLFVLILLVLRFFVDSTRFPEQNSNNTLARPILNTVNVSSNRSFIMYYPDNLLVQEIMIYTIQLIRSANSRFNATCILINNNKNNFKYMFIYLFFVLFKSNSIAVK